MEFTVDDCRSHMLAKPAVTEETPFGPDVLVYKVLGKMFATLAFDNEEGRMNLKCDPTAPSNSATNTTPSSPATT